MLWNKVKCSETFSSWILVLWYTVKTEIAFSVGVFVLPLKMGLFDNSDIMILQTV